MYCVGFLKENIKVSTEGKSTLKVRGERLIGVNKWNRFLQEFQAPEDCNMGGIHARFENGILTITMPITKKVPPPATATSKQEETTPQKPYIPPFLRAKDDHSPPLAPQTTPHIQDQQPLQPKVDFPPKNDDDDGFPPKTVRSSVERQKQATPVKTALKGDDDHDEDSHKETAPPKADFQRKPLNGTDGEGFPARPFQFGDEKQKQTTHMEGPALPKTHAEYQDDFPAAYKSLLHSVESQKKPALRPMFPKDYQDESPPKVAPSVLAAGAKQGDQKSLEGQEKVTGGGQQMKPLIGGLKDFVQGEKSSEVKEKSTITQTFDGRNKTTAEKERTGIDKDGQKEQSDKQTSMTGPIISGVKGLTDLKEERQLLVNAGVAVLVILALGAYIYNTVGTRKSD